MSADVDATVVYDTLVLVDGGREGKAASEDGHLRFRWRYQEMGGSGEGTNPEQLFAAGFAACFESSVRGVAGAQRVKIERSHVDSRVSILKGSDGSFSLRVAMAVELAGPDQETAEKLIDAAERSAHTPVAVKGNIDVSITVTAVA